MVVHCSLRTFCCLALVTRASLVHAQSSENVAAAEASFREGQRLLELGQVNDACQKFEASRTLDPGAGTSLNLGDCHERAGRTASAWGAFTEAVSLAQHNGDAEVEAEAKRRAQRVESQVPHVKLRYADAQLPESIRVVCDGKLEVAAALFGTAIPLDAGRHELTVTLPNHETKQVPFELGPNGQLLELTVPKLDPITRPAQLGPRPTPASPRPIHAEQRRSLVGVALAGGVGVVGLAVGGLYGIRAMNKRSDAYDNGCRDVAAQPVCAEPGYGYYHEAKSAAIVSTVAFGVGAVGAGAALYLWLTAPRAEATATQLGLDVSPTTGGVAARLRGAF